MSTGLFGVVATFRFYKSEDLGSNPGLIYIYMFFFLVCHFEVGRTNVKNDDPSMELISTLLT